MNNFAINFIFFNPFDDFMFSIVPVLVTVIFIVVISLFIINAIKGIKQWSYNNSQPVLTVDVEIVSKRIDVSHHHHNNNNHVHHHSTTTYYVTFQVESGDRLEFQVPANEYGLIREGDKGKLKFQGTRYLGFERFR